MRNIRKTKKAVTYSRQPHLEIFFTGQGVTADDYILHQLKHIEHPRQHTVVTSDKKLAWQSRRKGAHTVTIEEFLKLLNNRFKNKLKRTRQTPAPKLISAPTPLPLAESKKKEGNDYYLEHFETNFLKIVEAEAAKKMAKHTKTKKSAKTKKDNIDETLSNMERWMNAFERNLDND